MIRVIVDPAVPGNVNVKCRKMRRLTYLAWIARDMGCDVAVRANRQKIANLRHQRAYNGRSGFSYLNLLLAMPFTNSLDCDLLICSEETALGQNRPPCKVAAWRTTLGGGYKAIARQEKFDLLCGYVFSQQDWTMRRTVGGQERHDAPPENPLGDKWFSVPWLPFECTLDHMHQQGLWKAYLQDRLVAIRLCYGAMTKKRAAGFAGYPWPWRKKIARVLDDPRFVFLWPDTNDHEDKMPPDRYLEWLSECELSLNLPGDTWKCSRFAESVMMGVPVAHPRGVVHLSPPLTEENAILVSDWQELLTWDRWEDLPRIAANAADAYRNGWSLRGQFVEMMRRLGFGGLNASA